MGRKPLVWLHGEIKTPPFSINARIEAGTLLRLLQEGELLGLPESRPMPRIVIAEVFPKTTPQTPKHIINTCQRRLKLLDAVVKGLKK
jgi:hypothetical protein